MHDNNYLVNEPVYNNLVKLTEERMLLAPDIREDEPSHVCESRNLRTLVFGVVRPDVCHKQLHYVEVLVVLTRHVACDWQVKVDLDPAFDRVPQDGLVESW